MSEQHHQPRHNGFTPTLERHIHTFIAAILVGLVGWVGITLTSGQKDFAAFEGRFTERMSNLQEQISELKDEVASRRPVAVQVPNLERLLSNQERRLDILEDHIKLFADRLQKMESEKGRP